MGILAVAGSPSAEAFVRGLQELGYVDGKNIVIYRPVSATTDRLPTAAAELVRVKVDAIFAPATISVKVARDATSTIPIVFAGVADPIGSGFAASLARPGGNITGLGAINAELGPKRVELLKEAIPGLSRVGYLYDVGDAVSPLLIPDMEAGALALKIGFDRIGILGDSHLWVESGALLAYGASYEDLARRAAGYIDRIFKGELFVNLNTAKAQGLTLPPTLLIRADKLLE